MKTFAYERAGNVTDAVASLAGDPDARILAGGTNLVDLMRLNVERPDRLVDINRLDLTGISLSPDGSLRIGAGVRNSDLAADPTVRAHFPVLARALLAGASGQLRNMASTGGNLLQRTRCVYFMDATKPCNKRDPGSGCPAIEGLSRELGILGTSDQCIATHPGDMAVALTALGAVIHFQTQFGAESLAISDFYRLPGENPEQDTNLPPGAVITAVEIPALPEGAVSTYRKARDRRSYAFALGSVAAALVVDDGTVADVRLALGGVSAQPWRARVAEDSLRGSPATPENFQSAADAELSAATPTAQNAFKVELLNRLIVGTLTELTGQSSGSENTEPGEAQ